MTTQGDCTPNNEVTDNDVESWRRAIAELVQKAPKNTIKGCIRAYDPAKPTQQNIKALRSYCKEAIFETLKFLSKKILQNITRRIWFTSCLLIL